MELYWSERESESDIAWNGNIDFSVVCLHWVAMSSDNDPREFSLSLSRFLQYNSTLRLCYVMGLALQQIIMFNFCVKVVLF